MDSQQAWANWLTANQEIAEFLAICDGLWQEKTGDKDALVISQLARQAFEAGFSASRVPQI